MSNHFSSQITCSYTSLFKKLLFIIFASISLNVSSRAFINNLRVMLMCEEEEEVKLSRDHVDATTLVCDCPRGLA